MFSLSVVVGGPLPPRQEFELCELNFHWGRDDKEGSEHTINGKALPMEVSRRFMIRSYHKCIFTFLAEKSLDKHCYDSR